MKKDKIIKSAVIQDIFVKHQKKVTNFNDKQLFIPGTILKKSTSKFSVISNEQKPIPPDIINAFMIIINSILVDEAEYDADKSKLCSNSDYNSPEKAAMKILELIKLLSKDDKRHIEELRNAVIKSFVNATNSLGGKLPNILYKSLELVLNDIDKRLKESY